MNKYTKNIKTVLIYGTKNVAIATYKAITNNAENNVIVFGFLDDNEAEIEKETQSLNIYNLKKINKKFIDKNNIDQVILAIENIEFSKLLKITKSLFALNVQVKIIPKSLCNNPKEINIDQIKDIQIQDLFDRKSIQTKNHLVLEEYKNKTVLVTGAAGSIGSQLVRKLSEFQCKKLILLDNSESALYNLQQELKQNNVENIQIVLADIRNIQRIDQIFNTHKPEIIFHAAAYKHVPLMEENPFEAVSVNIYGTNNIAELALKYNAKKFILISTDKAVNPTNVMGATKRIAEISLLCLNKFENGKTKFIITRFGNVLGSNGSIIPLFKKQIQAGGPITVTHKDISRYFITLPEVSQLILESAAIGFGEEIFVFNINKPIKILDLAKNMILFSRLNYPQDIAIKIIGLRPGEKFLEELLIKGEKTQTTNNKKILIAKSKDVDINQYKKIKKLVQLDATISNIQIVSAIKDIVPEYEPNNPKYSILNKIKI